MELLDYELSRLSRASYDPPGQTSEFLDLGGITDGLDLS